MVTTYVQTHRRIQTARGRLHSVLSHIPKQRLSIPTPDNPSLIRLHTSKLITRTILSNCTGHVDGFGAARRLTRTVKTDGRLIRTASQTLLALLKRPIAGGSSFPDLKQGLQGTLRRQSNFTPRNGKTSVLAQLRRNVSADTRTLGTLQGRCKANRNQPNRTSKLSTHRTELTISLTIARYQFLILATRSLSLLAKP